MQVFLAETSALEGRHFIEIKHKSILYDSIFNSQGSVFPTSYACQKNCWK